MNIALPWHNYRPWLFAGVIALHLFALHWLFNDSPSNGIRGHVNKPSNDVVLILDFIESKKTVKKRPMTLVPPSPITPLNCMLL